MTKATSEPSQEAPKASPDRPRQTGRKGRAGGARARILGGVVLVGIVLTGFVLITLERPSWLAPFEALVGGTHSAKKAGAVALSPPPPPTAEERLGALEEELASLRASAAQEQASLHAFTQEYDQHLASLRATLYRLEQGTLAQGGVDIQPLVVQVTALQDRLDQLNAQIQAQDTRSQDVRPQEQGVPASQPLLTHIIARVEAGQARALFLAPYPFPAWPDFLARLRALTHDQGLDLPAGPIPTLYTLQQTLSSGIRSPEILPSAPIARESNPSEAASETANEAAGGWMNWRALRDRLITVSRAPPPSAPLDSGVAGRAVEVLARADIAAAIALIEGDAQLEGRLSTWLARARAARDTLARLDAFLARPLLDVRPDALLDAFRAGQVSE